MMIAFILSTIFIFVVIYLLMTNKQMVERFAVSEQCKTISPLDPDNMACDKGYFMRAISKTGLTCCRPPPPPAVLYGGAAMPHSHP